MTYSFSTGPYGEILPPPLAADATTDEIMEYYREHAGKLLQPDPARHNSETMEVIFTLARLLYQRAAILRVLSGETHDQVEAALYNFIVERRYPVSLRPLALEDLQYETFAPVLQRIEGNIWRVGVETNGKFMDFSAQSAAQAFEFASAIYVQWSNEERDGLSPSSSQSDCSGARINPFCASRKMQRPCALKLSNN